jgi:hypothetical protein
LLSYHVEARVIGYHVSDEQDARSLLGLQSVIASVAPLFISRIKRMWLLGATVLTSYVITTILHTDYIVSVWCFIASIINTAVDVIIYNLKSTNQPTPDSSINSAEESRLNIADE